MPLSSMLTGAAVVAAGTLVYGLRRILTDGPTIRQDDSTHHRTERGVPVHVHHRLPDDPLDSDLRARGGGADSLLRRRRTLVARRSA
ncbi:hypothetical protein B0T36_08610 [Nocardia donostiensis]|nr:hypothetical protein B0T36_08610 [Nocardia donostiensis]